MQGRTLRDLAADFLRQGLGMVPTKLPGQLPANSMLTIGDGGLPVITSRANAKALQMSVQDLLKLEQETLTQEDMQRAGHPV